MNMKKILRLTKAVSDGNRVRILMALAYQEELCACHISELLQVSAPTVSRHMGILEAAGLVTARKDSRWVYYRIAKESRDAEFSALMDWLVESLRGDVQILADRAALAAFPPCDGGTNCRAIAGDGVIQEAR